MLYTKKLSNNKQMIKEIPLELQEKIKKHVMCDAVTYLGHYKITFLSF